VTQESQTEDQTERAVTSPLHVLVVLPGLEMGGSEKATCRLLNAIDRKLIRMSVAVFKSSGACLRLVPEDVPVHILGPHSGLKRIRTVLRLARLVRRERVEVVYAVLDSANIVALFARLLGILPTPLLIGVRCNYRWGLGKGVRWRRVKRLLVRLLYPRADRILCVTDEALRVIAEDFGVPKNRCDVLGNVVPSVGRPSHPSDGADALGDWLSGAVPLFLAIGRLIEVKQFDKLLEAFQLVRNETAARLLIIGEGPDRPRLESLVHRLGLSDQCRLPGEILDPMPCMQRAASLVVTSRAEGFPNVVAEALACGLRVISFDWAEPVVRMIEATKLGEVVQRDNHEALASAMLRVLQVGPAFGEDGVNGPYLTNHSMGTEPGAYERVFVSVARAGVIRSRGPVRAFAER
jgi:glycosyltransferase involved in cell wall biosynthesis